jgi:histidine ammonia-lyase
MVEAAVSPAPVTIGQTPLTVSQVVDIARHGAMVVLDSSALARVEAARAVIDQQAASPDPRYGVSTGFGALATTFITPDRRQQLQLSLVRSHAAGTGDEVAGEIVRALMVLRLQTLMTGHTGVRSVVCEVYREMLNQHITPQVFRFGSLGCSGDLAPLAHVALVACGEGRARDASGDLVDGGVALADAGIAPLVLQEKEGLALINGTDGMLGMLCLALHDISMLLDTADVAAAMSVEGLLGTDRVFQSHLHELRPHAGQAISAGHMAAVLADSPIVASHAGPDDARVQDAYSLRCAPQVTGAVRDTWAHAKAVADVELRSAIDNPVVTAAGQLESNGNFHGAPIGYVLDFLAIALADLASISERRTDRFLDVSRNQGLPPFLAHEPGVDSGLMIAHYTQAGLVSHMKRLAVPASVDSIPTSAMQEDHVSMGWHAGLDLIAAVDACWRVVAIEIMTASRGLALRAPLAPSPLSAQVMELMSEVGATPGPDRFLAPEIEAATEKLRHGVVSTLLNTYVGKAKP